MKTQHRIATLLLLAMAGIGPAGLAHADAAHGKKNAETAISTEETEFGRQGDPRKVDRDIRVDMNDKMQFSPADITVRQGETIRFVVSNSGKVMHEMVIGTMDGLKRHQAAMQQHPEMEHDDPFSKHVAPGKKEALVWKFTQVGEFHYACLIPGHFEAGMVGTIKVVKARHSNR